MKWIATALTALCFAHGAQAFESGKYQCISTEVGANGLHGLTTFTLSKVSLKTDSGEVTLPYIDYSFDDKNGYQVNARGLGQMSGDSMSNTLEWSIIQMDSHSFRIVMKNNKIQTNQGECQKLN